MGELHMHRVVSLHPTDAPNIELWASHSPVPEKIEYPFYVEIELTSLFKGIWVKGDFLVLSQLFKELSGLLQFIGLASMIEAIDNTQEYMENERSNLLDGVQDLLSNVVDRTQKHTETELSDLFNGLQDLLSNVVDP